MNQKQQVLVYFNLYSKLLIRIWISSEGEFIVLYHMSLLLLFLWYVYLLYLRFFYISFPFLYQSIVPPIFGLDLSPILAFVLLNVLTSATAAVGAEITPNDEKKIKQLLSSQQYNGLRPFPVKPYYNKKTTTATW